MFKELGEFIDNVGRATGIVVKRLLSDNEPLEMTGIGPMPELSDEDLPEGLKEELEKCDYKVINNKDDV